MTIRVKLIFVLLISFLWGLQLSAQDTIKVQTLTYDSVSRSGNFIFPSLQDGPFKKILMKYSIRCHGAAVGNLNVGCREWDYSCNTFVTDSSMMDSTLAFHPSYSITNINDDLFPYRNSPVLSYIERVQSSNTLTNGRNETKPSINGIDDADLEFGISTISNLHTFIYSAESLQNNDVKAGNVYGFIFEVEGDGAEFVNLRVSLKQIDQATRLFDGANGKDYSEHYFSNTLVKDNSLDITFDQEFNWDGQSDLAIQLNWDEIQHSAISFNTHTQVQSRLSNKQEEFAFRMNGAQSISVPKSTFTNISDEISICYWAFGNPSILPKNTSTFESVNANNQREINIHHPWSNEQIYWDCGKVGNGTDRINKAAPKSLTEGKWNFWSFTKNSNTGIMNIYVNGALWHTGNGKNAPIGNIERTIIGKSATLTNAYNGKLKGFTIWNKALDKDAINIMMLSAEEIPDFNDHLQLAYLLNQSNTIDILDVSLHGNHGLLQGYSNSWYSLRGFEKQNNSSTIGWNDNVPNMVMIQGEYDIESEEVEVRDSVFNLPNRVIRFIIEQNNLVAVDTQYLWDANEILIYDEAGEIIDYIEITNDGELEIDQLRYFNQKPAKFELLSMVTPYGNGLDLGPKGVQFTFDVSDFAPVLHGTKYLNMQMGGENQEEVDIQFEFIKGEPYQEVKSIDNIWPFSRGWFKAIQDDNVFENRMMVLNKDASIFKVNMSITGHGQNGEFLKRNHYFNVDGNKKFNWDVWMECSTIPIFPQGGTWLNDRAGWCPGTPSLITNLDITKYVEPGKTVTMDYGVNGFHMDEANYLVSSQLISYGAPNKQLDVDLIDIITPSKKIEHFRFNPACNEPTIRVKNIGTDEITSLKIQYTVVGGKSQEYNWQGSIDYLEEELIVLPLWNDDFWVTAVGPEKGVFEATILSINGKQDEDQQNNVQRSQFELPDVHDKDEMKFEYRTNTRGSESSYTLKNREGKILYQNKNLANSTSYKDDLILGPGCYTLEFSDTGDDGLYYWFHERTNPRGTGSAKLTYKKGNRTRTLKSFEPEFGRFFRYDFGVKSLTATKDDEGIKFLLSTYPNPVNDLLNVDIILPKHSLVDLRIVDQMGKIIKHKTLILGTELETIQFNTSDMISGFYILLVKVEGKVYQRKVVVD